MFFQCTIYSNEFSPTFNSLNHVLWPVSCVLHVMSSFHFLSLPLAGRGGRLPWWLSTLRVHHKHYQWGSFLASDCLPKQFPSKWYKWRNDSCCSETHVLPKHGLLHHCVCYKWVWNGSTIHWSEVLWVGFGYGLTWCRLLFQVLKCLALY